MKLAQEVVVSCGGIRQERPPIVLENILCALDSMWGASRAGGLLLQQQPRAGRKASILDTVLACHGVPPHQPPAQEGEDWQQQKHALISLLDDSPGAPDLARVRDATLLWAGLCFCSLLCSLFLLSAFALRASLRFLASAEASFCVAPLLSFPSFSLAFKGCPYGGSLAVLTISILVSFLFLS